MSDADAKHMERVSSLGCIVCLRMGNGYVPAEVHHLLKNGRRMGHKHTIPLCYPHHRQGINTPDCVSRHPWRKEFQRRYGTELELLKATYELLGITYQP